MKETHCRSRRRYLLNRSRVYFFSRSRYPGSKYGSSPESYTHTVCPELVVAGRMLFPEPPTSAATFPRHAPSSILCYTLERLHSLLSVDCHYHSTLYMTASLPFICLLRWRSVGRSSMEVLLCSRSERPTSHRRSRPSSTPLPLRSLW